MLSTNLELSNYNVLLEKICTERYFFNYLAVLDSFHIVCFLIDDIIQIILKHDITEEQAFYRVIFEELLNKNYHKSFYFLKADEKKLANLYKKYKLPVIKKWYSKVDKQINQIHNLNFNSNLYATISFELTAYNESDYKQSKQFYFIDLLLQHLESKIKLSYETVNKSSLYDTSVGSLLRETDYILCFSHIFQKSTQTYSEIPDLHETLQRKLLSKGINKVYSYQKEAFEQIYGGKSVVITAPTGNGKTESFLLPVLQKLLIWKNTLSGVKVILLYPTKALAADQLVKINYFLQETGLQSVHLDSDVSKENRNTIYSSTDYDILITTPDLIHYSLQKNEFQKFIQTTKIIVFDEVHTYTGTFGTHVYYFLRRLERILLEKKKIQYIAASATIANPIEFTSNLFARKMVHIDCRTPKRNATELYCIQRKKNVSRYDSIFQLVSMITSLQDEKILVFRNSQQEVERTFQKLKQIKTKKIALHRAGLNKKQRQHIEKELRENKLDVVVTTTTLEVGIDIGGLTTIITPIVPINRLVQRIGRAGRGTTPAKVFLELEHNPISFYYAEHAESYLKDISSVNITTENKSIASQHRALLQKENSEIDEYDIEIFGRDFSNTVEMFSLRNINTKIIVKNNKNYKITEKELPQAFYEFYPYSRILQNGTQYLVESIEKESDNITAIVTPIREKDNYKINVRPMVERKVFTNAQVSKIDFIKNVEVKLSDCKVNLEYRGNIVNFKEHVLLDSYNYDYCSKCVIFNFEDKIADYVEYERNIGLELGSIVHTLSHVLYKSAKMIIHCGKDLINMENSIGMWKIIFVDNAINGNGLSELFFEKRIEIWERALKILKDCKCSKKEGCIKCTIDFDCALQNRSLIKSFFQNFN